MVNKEEIRNKEVKQNYLQSSVTLWSLVEHIDIIICNKNAAESSQPVIQTQKKVLPVKSQNNPATQFFSGVFSFKHRSTKY